MNKRTRYTLLALGINLLLFVLLLLPLFFLQGHDAPLTWLFVLLFLVPTALLIQLVVGIVFALGQKRKELGQALLLATGLILLIGFSVCGGIAYGS